MLLEGLPKPQARAPTRHLLAAPQDSLAGWAAALLEGFPTLRRLLLNHNSDAAASRVASMAPTPQGMTPRTLTPANLRWGRAVDGWVVECGGTGWVRRRA